jgi:hypothetical protein
MSMFLFPGECTEHHSVGDDSSHDRQADHGHVQQRHAGPQTDGTSEESGGIRPGRN